MKTSLLYRVGSRYIRRALLPSDGKGDSSRKVAKFIPKHEESGDTLISLTPYKTKPFTRTVPNSVYVGDRFPFERGVCKYIKVGDPVFLARVHEIDEEIERLGREREAALEDAFIRGRSLRESDLKDGEVTP